MSEQLKFYKGNQADLPKSGIEIGALYHCVDTGNTYRGVSDTKMELFGNTIGFTQLNGGVVIGEGFADGEYSIAAGTSDDSIATELVGSTIDSYFTITAPEAKGTASHAYGASTKSYSSGSRAYGVNSQAGYLGYYIWSISGNTLTLSTTQKKSILSSKKKPAESVLKNWKVGMTVSAVANDYYPCFAKITSVDSANGTITVDNIPFSDLGQGSTMAPHDSSIIAIPDVTKKSILGQSFEVTRPECYGEVDLGIGAVADGFDNIAAGVVSTAFGYRNTAIGTAAFVTGRDNFGGFATLVGGLRNKVLGKESIAAGRDNTAIGEQSAIVGKENIASGKFNFVSGYQNETTGNAATAEGVSNKATGKASHVEGTSNEASGENAHADGNKTIASGMNAQAHGAGTIARSRNQTVIGRYNDPDMKNADGTQAGEFAFIIGRGTGENELDDAGNIVTKKRGNAATVDWSGNAWFKGSVMVGSGKLATEAYVNERTGTPDWAENDETSSAYIKNRTHWYQEEKVGKLLANETTIYDELYNFAYRDDPIRVYVDGVKYNTRIETLYYHEDLGTWFREIKAGDLSIVFDDGNNTGVQISGNYSSFEIYELQEAEYHKLDKNYLPDDTVYEDEILKFYETASIVESLSMQCKSTYIADKYINTFHGGSLTSVTDIMLPADTSVELGNHYITFHRKYNLAPIDYTKFDGRTVSHQNGAFTSYWSEDGKIVLNGTATTTATIALTGSVDSGPYTYLPAGTYRINGMQFGYFNIIDGVLGSTKKYVYAYEGASSNGAFSTGANYAVPAEFTVTFNNPILVFRWALYVKSGLTFDSSVFVPYVYRIPDPDKDGKTYSVNITSSGIELWDDIDGGQIATLSPEQFYSKLPARITTIKNPELGTWDCSFSDDCETNPVDYVSITNKSTKEWCTGSVGHVITTFGDAPKKQAILYGTNEPDNFLGEDGDIYIMYEE